MIVNKIKKKKKKYLSPRPDRISPVQLFNPLLYLFHLVLKQKHVQTSFEKICREAIFPAKPTVR